MTANTKPLVLRVGFRARGVQDLSEEELAARRRRIDRFRADAALEGITPPAEIYDLEERFVRGEITEAELEQACSDFGDELVRWKGAKQKSS